MTPIATTINGLHIELTPPDPIEQDGQWWEFTTPFIPKKGDKFLIIFRVIEKCNVDFLDDIINLRWRADPIPRATPEQLAVIGKKERDGGPMECKAGDVIWCNNGYEIRVTPQMSVIGKHRWVLVPAEKEPERWMICPDVQVCPTNTGCPSAKPHKHESSCERSSNTCPKCIPYIEPAPEPEYDYLKVGDIKQKEDEFNIDILEGFIKTGDVGKVFTQEEKDKGMIYRRKRKVEPAPAKPTLCLSCTTPRLSCPLANEPHDSVTECGSYNMPTPAPEKHYFCFGCAVPSINILCHTCHGSYDTYRHMFERKNYTPAKDALPLTTTKNESMRQQAGAWEAVYKQCKQLGMKSDLNSTAEQDVCAFIRELAERFTVEQTKAYLKTMARVSPGGSSLQSNEALMDAIELIDNPKYGIAAATNKGDHETD